MLINCSMFCKCSGSYSYAGNFHCKNKATSPTKIIAGRTAGDKLECLMTEMLQYFYMTYTESHSFESGSHIKANHVEP